MKEPTGVETTYNVFSLVPHYIKYCNLFGVEFGKLFTEALSILTSYTNMLIHRK